MRWLRLDVSWDDSPWLFVLSAASQLAWIKLLCHVKRDGSQGRCKALAHVVAAKRWGVGEEDVQKLLQAAVNDGALVIEDGAWTLSNWDKYQEQDHGAAERMRRMRAKSVTPCYAVTGPNEDVTRRVTETETETREKKEPTVPKKREGQDEDWARFCAAYPKRSGDLGKAKGRVTFLALVRSGTDPERIIDGARRYSEFEKVIGKWGTEFVKQIPTFLNGRAWEEDFDPPPTPVPRNGRPTLAELADANDRELERRENLRA